MSIALPEIAQSPSSVHSGFTTAREGQLRMSPSSSENTASSVVTTPFPSPPNDPIAHSIVDVPGTTLKDSSNRANASASSTVLSFQNISYTVYRRRPNAFARRSARTALGGDATSPEAHSAPKPIRCILDDTSGFARSEEVTAIVGPSGSGKTTLLDVLAHRIAAAHSNAQQLGQAGGPAAAATAAAAGCGRTGSVEVDGVPVTGDMMRRFSAYVMQDDLMHATLTARETLMFSAEMNLPSTAFTRKEKEAKVERLLELLGLSHVANSIIGDENKRGVSGGERKRVAIGAHIVHDPKLLFLDEPTSGLDSTNACRVVRILKDVAVQSRSVVVMVLHQPSFRILELIDRLLLLAAGRAVFFGPPATMPAFFAAYGRPVPQFANPAEYAMELLDQIGAADAAATSAGDAPTGLADLHGFALEYLRGRLPAAAGGEQNRLTGGKGGKVVRAIKASGGVGDGEADKAATEETALVGGAGAGRADDVLVVTVDAASPGSDASDAAAVGCLPSHAMMSPLCLPSRPAAAGAAAAPAAAVPSEPRRLSSSSVSPVAIDSQRAAATTAAAAVAGSARQTMDSATATAVAAAAAGGGAGADNTGGFVVSKGDGSKTVVLLANHKGAHRFANSWCRELYVLTCRAALIICRNPALYALRLGLLTVAGLLLSSLFWRPPHDPKGLLERLAFLSFISAVLFFCSADATPIFIQDRHIFIRETSHNTYRTSTYVIAHAAVYVPLQLLMALVITTESWLCVGLSGGAVDFLFMFLLCFCCLFNGNAISTLISAFFKNVILAYAMVISIMAYFTIISGFYIHRTSIPTFWIWLHYLSPIKYAYEGLVLNEFDRGNASCYLTLNQIAHIEPLTRYINVTRAEAALDVFLPAVLSAEAGNVTDGSCLLYGERVYSDLLDITQMNKWQCLATLFCMALTVRFAYFCALTAIYKAKRR